MSSCECCWQSRHKFTDSGEATDAGEAYHLAMKEHEDRHCVCTTDTEEGRMARAGQFWDEERKIDRREEAP